MKLDVGVKHEGYFTDSAIKVLVGTIDEASARLMATTKAALDAGIDAARVGRGPRGSAFHDIVGGGRF